MAGHGVHAVPLSRRATNLKRFQEFDKIGLLSRSAFCRGVRGLGRQVGAWDARHSPPGSRTLLTSATFDDNCMPDDGQDSSSHALSERA